uniref:Secreted protein n=1 Tax=Heterorhabditis bacteriophora TaxID=37862 RepID=A0A1I7WC34_HETBA
MKMLICLCFKLMIFFEDQFLADKSSRLIERLFSYMPLVSNKGARLQVIVCSATLHNFEIKKFAVGFFVFDMFLAYCNVISLLEEIDLG